MTSKSNLQSYLNFSSTQMNTKGLCGWISRIVSGAKPQQNFENYVWEFWANWSTFLFDVWLLNVVKIEHLRLLKQYKVCFFLLGQKYLLIRHTYKWKKLNGWCLIFSTIFGHLIDKKEINIFLIILITMLQNQKLVESIEKGFRALLLCSNLPTYFSVFVNFLR